MTDTNTFDSDLDSDDLENATAIPDTTVNIDIIIFIDEEFSKKLCDYLGFIYAEAVLIKAEEDIASVIYRLINKTSELYRLIQTYINKYLVNGYNNIYIVNNLSLWENFNANVKIVISTDMRNLNFVETVKTSNFHINLGKNNISLLNYRESVAVLIDKALKSESLVVAEYECEENWLNYR